MASLSAIALVLAVLAAYEQGDPVCFVPNQQPECDTWTGPGNPPGPALNPRR